MNDQRAPEITLGDEGAWDDTALIDSWDEAVNEYKKYHSIHRAGKRLEDMLDEEELEQIRAEHEEVLGAVETSSSRAERNIHADSKAADVPEMATNGKWATGMNQVPSPGSGHAAGATATAETSTAQANPPGFAMPQALLGSVPDENLKNLMMSWYYAGYYTGLHAGQGGPTGSTTSK